MDHLRPFVGNVLGESGQKVDGIKNLEVAVSLGFQSGPVDDRVGRGFQRHFLNGERIAEDLLAELFAFGPVFRGRGSTGVHIKRTLPPLKTTNPAVGAGFVCAFDFVVVATAWFSKDQGCAAGRHRVAW